MMSDSESEAMSDSKSEGSHDASVPDHVNLALFVAGKQRKPKRRTCYMYRNSALSAAGAMMCECIQREKANLQVKQNELLIQMMLYIINTLKSRGDGQKKSNIDSFNYFT
jgi:hypothetical protein